MRKKPTKIQMMTEIPKTAKLKILQHLKSYHRIPRKMLYSIVIDESGYEPKNRMEWTHLTSLCQKFISELRNVEGRRLVYFVAKQHSINNISEYVTVRTCDDERELLYIKHKMYNTVAGLEYSVSTINGHLATLNEVQGCFDLAIKRESEEDDDE